MRSSSFLRLSSCILSSFLRLTLFLPYFFLLYDTKIKLPMSLILTRISYPGCMEDTGWYWRCYWWNCGGDFRVSLPEISQAWESRGELNILHQLWFKCSVRVSWISIFLENNFFPFFSPLFGSFWTINHQDVNSSSIRKVATFTFKICKFLKYFPISSPSFWSWIT